MYPQLHFHVFVTHSAAQIWHRCCFPTSLFENDCGCAGELLAVATLWFLRRSSALAWLHTDHSVGTRYGSHPFDVTIFQRVRQLYNYV